MKFSEQIVLGSTLIEFDPTVYLDTGCGCFIGMAGASIGESSFQGGSRSLARIGELWPWLEKQQLVSCPVCEEKYPDYTTAISCLALHVHARQWTFEEALEYIRSVEPGEVDDPQTVIPVWNRYHWVTA